jgi:hypothetical protein
MTRLLLALSLCAGLAQAGDEPPKPMPGESPQAFQCRVKHLPVVRSCLEACREKAAGDARWECTHGCTTRGVWAMAQCRETAAAQAAR